MTREQERNLDIEIGFLEGVVRRDPGYIDALQILGDNYTRRGRFEDGLKVDEQLVRLRPGDALVYYNLACSYSLTEQFESAAAALNRALDLGYRDFKWLSKDPDLAKLRKHPAVAANRQGETILVWTEGMAWSKGGDLAWQVFDKEGKPTADKGRAKGVPAWSLVAVFARPEGGFTVVY